eukprot:548473_1
MTELNFVDKFMQEFQNKLQKITEEILAEYLETYKLQIIEANKSNDRLLSESVESYHKQIEELVSKMNITINQKLTDAKRNFERKLQQIDDDLFNNANSLYQNILSNAKTLQQKQKCFDEQRRKWNRDDKRIADYLGIPIHTFYANDDEKKAEFALMKNKENISDSDHIIIKIDDKIFHTTRYTLTQVKESFLSKLFGAHHDMMYRDNQGAYYLNCNPNTFAQVLDILRNKGSVSKDFVITHKLHAMLLQFGIVNQFFPSFDVSMINVANKNKMDCNPVFKSYRSTAVKNTYFVCWNVELLSSVERKEDDKKYWKINRDNDSEIEFAETGYYRIVFRTCIYYSSHGYAQLRINTNYKAYAYNYGYSSNNYKSYNFNEIIEIKTGDKLSFYVYPAPYTEQESSYLCIERISDSILPLIAIFKSSSTNANYRIWNNAIKISDKVNVSTNKITIQKGGLYRISSRVHSNYSGGVQYMYLCEYRNGSCNYIMSAKGTGTCGYQCHVFDEICNLKHDDYLMMYDGAHGTVNDINYQCFQIEYLPIRNVYGVWKSSSVVLTYQRVWDYEYWNNDMLFSLNNTKNVITIKQDGIYRVASHITQNTNSNQGGYSAWYINNSQYCLARYGACGSTYQHTTTIQEIVKFTKGDTFYVYVYPTPYNNKDYNSLYIERLC